MPVYEYRCPKCGRKWNKIWMSLPDAGEEAGLRCRSCGTGGLKRLFSPFARPRSDEERLARLADGSALAGLDESDPRSLARIMRRMSEETGEPLEGEEQEMLERMEAGEIPDDDAAGGPGGGAGDDFL